MLSKNGIASGPADSVIAMTLDSHTVNRGSSPGLSGLKLTLGACGCLPKILRGKWRRDYSIAISLGVSVLLFCLSVSLVSTHALQQKSFKTPPPTPKIKKALFLQ